MSELPLWLPLAAWLLALCLAVTGSMLVRRAVERLRRRWPAVRRTLAEPGHDALEATIERLVRRVADDPVLARHVDVAAHAVAAVACALVLYLLTSWAIR